MAVGSERALDRSSPEMEERLTPRQHVARTRTGLSRRTFLKGSVAAGGAVLGGGLWSTALRPSRVKAADTPINHIVVSMQENRSFDHYFGYAPQVQAAGLGPPAGFTQPDAAGNPHAPFEFTQFSTPQPNQNWQASHAQLDGGKMD